MTEHGSAEWYAMMADLMKKREHAQLMIDRWSQKLGVAEAEILALSGSGPAEPEAAQS